MDDMEQKIKQDLLLDLISKMSDQSGERLKPKGLAVEVAAPDKSKLAEGLDKAKGVLGSVPEPDDVGSSSSSNEDDDEQRMMELLSKEDDEDEPGRR